MLLNIPHPFQLCTASECREMDARTINEFGIDGFTLMEIAGNKAADFILGKLEKPSHGLYFCGKGNNAGDALVVARVLHQYGHQATLVFVNEANGLSESTDKNWSLLHKLNEEAGGSISILQGFEEQSIPNDFDFIIDGLFGTGLNSEIAGVYADAVRWIKEQKTPVFSMDIPSGLNPDTGLEMGISVQADYTLAFGARKLGFYLQEYPQTTGEIVYCDLPFPKHLRNGKHYLIDESWVSSQSKIKKRKHKYDGGILHIIAGSEGLTGAAVLAAKSAWATGIGAVQIITPKGLLDVYEKNLIEIIKRPVGSTEDVFFNQNHLESVQQVLSEKPGVLLIGPGLGRTTETQEFTRQLLQSYTGTSIIDADALFAISEKGDIKKLSDATWILTPHPGELTKLAGNIISAGASRLETIESLASTMDSIIVSKGSPTIIGTPSGNKYITGYQTDIFSRAGFGDVLAGKIAANTLMHENSTLAISKALLDGKAKADTFLSNHNQTSPAPLDII